MPRANGRCRSSPVNCACRSGCSGDGIAWQLAMGDQVHHGQRRHARRMVGMEVWLDGMRETRRRHAHWRQHHRAPQRRDVASATARSDGCRGGGRRRPAGRLVAPIPGQVTQVSAEPGMAVTRGQVMVVLEAMKTVFRLAAPCRWRRRHRVLPGRRQRRRRPASRRLCRAAMPDASRNARCCIDRTCMTKWPPRQTKCRESACGYPVRRTGTR